MQASFKLSHNKLLSSMDVIERRSLPEGTTLTLHLTEERDAPAEEEAGDPTKSSGSNLTHIESTAASDSSFAALHATDISFALVGVPHPPDSNTEGDTPIPEQSEESCSSRSKAHEPSPFRDHTPVLYAVESNPSAGGMFSCAASSGSGEVEDAESPTMPIC